jgi:FkbM family methyltransferase
MRLPVLSLPTLRIRQCRHGLMAFHPHDTRVGHSLDQLGEYAQNEMALLAQLLPEGTVVIDVGANVGPHTIFFAKQVGPSGAVMAFEPRRILHQTLCANVALNELTNVFALWEALGDHPGGMTVPPVDYAAAGDFGAVSLRQEGPGEPVRLSTLDQIDLAVCHLLKIDVSGMEAAVLDGARETIRRLQPALYVKTEQPDSHKGVIERLLALGYRVWQHRVPLFRPDNFFGTGTNELVVQSSINVLALPAAVGSDIALPELKSPDDGQP